MATLVFRVSAQYDEVIKLRNEISKLEAQLKKMDVNKSPAAAKALETQLASTRQQMMGLVTEAARAGAVMENDFKTKIYNASQTVNDFTQKIIDQKKVVKDVEYDVKRLAEAYKVSLKRNPFGATEQLSEYKAAKKALEEEKAALFGLTQQQAEARLSVKKLKDEYSAFREEAGETAQANEKMSLSLTKVLGIIGGVTALKGFASELIRVRGEFQSMETAIETLVGKNMANKLIPQIKELAKISPLTMSDMVGAEKMMLGFNIQAEDTIRYLQALSDISMGDSVKFNSLTLAFSQMSAAGKLMGQDLNQMINAGFNPLQVISEETGKSIATLKDEMSKGALSAEMVQQAFIDATSAGGKFYQMSENASKTINGQISMMQDALDAVFNEIGQASEEVIMKGIQATTSLIQNYETVGKVLIGLIATYGTYRAALMLATVATSKHTIAEIALTSARVVARKAQMLLNASMLTNPYVAVATVLAGLVATMWAFHDSSTEAEKAQKRLNERQQEAQKEAEEHKRRIDALVESSRDIALSDLQRGQSLAELRKEYPKIFAQYDIESIKLADILKLKRQISEEDAKRAGERQKNDFAELNKRIAVEEFNVTMKKGTQAARESLKKLEGLYHDRDAILQERGKGISEQFISSLKDIDINEFDLYISELEKRIKGKGENGKIKMRIPIDVKGSLSDEALFEVKDIKTLIDTAKSTKQSRIESKNNQTTYQQDLAAAKADWEKAKQGYEALIKDQKATSEQVKKAREEMEAKEKAYKELGGDVDKKKQVKGSSPFPKFEQNYSQELEKQADAAEEATTDTINDMVQTMLDGLDAEQEAMYKYLRNYGTFREQQQAITEEYSKKIAEAGGADTWQGKLLGKERDQVLSDLYVKSEDTASAISRLFGDMKDKTLGELQDINLKGSEALEFLKSGEWDEDKGAIFGITKEQFDTLKQSPEALEAISNALNDNRHATDRLRPAYGKVEDGLKKMFDAGDDSKKLKEALTDIRDGLDEIIQLGSFASDVFSNMGDAFGSDMLKGVSDGISVAMDTVNATMTGAQAGSMFGPMGSIVGGAVGFATSLASSIAGMFGADYSEYENMKAQYDTLISVWDTLIGKKTEYIDIDYGVEAQKAADEAARLVGIQIQRQRQLAKMLASSGSSVGSHSLAYRVNDRMNSSDWSNLSVLVGKQVGTLQDVLNLDADVIGKVLQDEHFVSVLTTVNSDFIEYIQNIEKYSEQLGEIAEKEREALTGIGFDAFRDGYLDMLSDLESTNEDFADNFEKNLQNAILSSLVANKYSDRIKSLYEDWAKAGEDGLTSREAEELRREQQQIVEDMLADREQLMEDFGWSSSSEQQSASSRGFGTEMTHEDAGELSGRFTAVYESNLRIEAAEQQQTVAITELRGSISALTAQTSGIYNIADETRTILANSYLELQQIRENTGEIVKPIKQMQADIAEVKRNTSRL